MPLSSASVLSGATLTPSGGSAISFVSAGIRNEVNTLNCSNDADLRTRRQIVCSTREPRPSEGAPNGYTQARATAFLKFPLELENGNVTINTVRIEVAYDVETSASELTEYKVIAAQVLNDSDFSALFSSLSLA